MNELGWLRLASKKSLAVFQACKSVLLLVLGLAGSRLDNSCIVGSSVPGLGLEAGCGSQRGMGTDQAVWSAIFVRL